VELLKPLEGFKEVTTALKDVSTSHPRTIFQSINRAQTLLTTIMKHIRELSSLFGDTSLFNSFNKRIRILNQLLTGMIPFFAIFHKLILVFEANFGRAILDLKSFREVVKLWKQFGPSQTPDREMIYIVGIEGLIAHEMESTRPDVRMKLDNLIDEADLFVNSSGQLQIYNAIETCR
jgi:hypothetical protein